MSAKFTFRLEAAIGQRARAEQSAQLAYARAIQEHRSAQEALDALRLLAAEGRREVSTLGTPMDTERRMNLLLYVDQATLRARHQEQVVARRTAEVEEAQLTLRQAAARRRALERLRERRLEEFTTEERMRVERELDERTTLRYARGKA
ncbi:MAG: flagellar FliJ family protein [Chloroflexota bacterium]